MVISALEWWSVSRILTEMFGFSLNEWVDWGSVERLLVTSDPDMKRGMNSVDTLHSLSVPKQWGFPLLESSGASKNFLTLNLDDIVLSSKNQLLK